MYLCLKCILDVHKERIMPGDSVGHKVPSCYSDRGAVRPNHTEMHHSLITISSICSRKPAVMLFLLGQSYKYSHLGQAKPSITCYFWKDKPYIWALFPFFMCAASASLVHLSAKLANSSVSSPCSNIWAKRSSVSLKSVFDDVSNTICSHVHPRRTGQMAYSSL